MFGWIEKTLTTLYMFSMSLNALAILLTVAFTVALAADLISGDGTLSNFVLDHAVALSAIGLFVAWAINLAYRSNLFDFFGRLVLFALLVGFGLGCLAFFGVLVLAAWKVLQQLLA